MKKPRFLFEMPPVIGDQHLPHKRTVEAISVDFGGEGGKWPYDPLKIKGVNLRLAVPHSREFMEAFMGDKRYEYAIL
ncbi:MAG: hypothetical protein Q8S00_06015 [Deltaproteobacteria bacterium]|nr:hypothetical protein [Deltaproteobacteria bacterium]MDZ4345594.1 hypothetical protein [Candidatus Binatia bacterium]